jgi:short-subunit dehydrogenase
MSGGEKPVALVIGAVSDIGRAVARAFAVAGYNVQLAARDADRLDRDAEDLHVRYGAAVGIHEIDMLEPESFAAFADGLVPLPTVAVSVVGLMGDHEENLRDPAAAQRVIDTNFSGPAALMGLLGGRFAARGSGILVGIGSVAGDRGRAGNYVYGASKAGFAAYLSGLRHRLADSGVHVVTVKPGYVDTAMTEDMELPRVLTAQPEEVGRAVLRAVEKRRNTIYVRPIWRLIMAVIRAIPEPIFKRMKL